MHFADYDAVRRPLGCVIVQGRKSKGHTSPTHYDERETKKRCWNICFVEAAGCFQQEMDLALLNRRSRPVRYCYKSKSLIRERKMEMLEPFNSTIRPCIYLRENISESQAG